MCHPEVPDGAATPDVARHEISFTATDGVTMPTLLASPVESARGAVVIAADIFGRSPFYEDIAARLAIAGFATLLPDLFARQGPPSEPTREAVFTRRAQMDDAQALRDMTSAIEVARDHGRVGTIGFCMGGTFVLQTAARKLGVATVCYYGFPVARGPSAVPSPMDLVDDLEGPILGFWGEQDEAVGMDNLAGFVDEVAARGIDFEHTVYPDVGHGFMAASKLDPSHAAYQPACDSWTRTVQFFRDRL
jgi:carboxymethylenebutenolidase